MCHFIVANVLFFYFFVYLYYPMKFKRKYLEGPSLAPPCFEKSGPPLLKKKLDPLPWAFGARPRMVQLYAEIQKSAVCAKLGEVLFAADRQCFTTVCDFQ